MDPKPPDSLVTLADASAYLDGLINRERSADYSYVRLDLRPIEALLEALGHPERRLSVLHVAGSKGKGSTCLFAEAILRELGECVGTFTSPHLESWLERFRIDGRPVDEGALVAAVERVRPAVDRLRSGPPETVPSFFDATTAVAFLLFAEARVDRAIMEVGLGGRLDSTNVVDPIATCITSIELEHTDKLGATEALIAGEKAGILKPSVPVVLGPLRADADRVIRARAAERAAPVIACGSDFEIESRPAPSGDHGDGDRSGPGRAGPGLVFRMPGEAPLEIELRVPGEAARINAGLAIACVRALAAHAPEAVATAARVGLARCVLPARSEILAQDPAILIDSAHTAESAKALARVLEDWAPKGCALLLSVSSDKDLKAIFAALLPRAVRVFVTRADPQRSLAADRLAERIRAAAPQLPLEIIEDPDEATRRARRWLHEEAPASRERRLCATGSVYLAGIARRLLARQN